MFSPYYAWRRRAGAGVADPLAHCAVNVALHGDGGDRWAMTERHGSAVQRSADALAIGRSRVAWDGDALVIAIDELTFPVPGRIRGTVRVHPGTPTGRSFALDAGGRHVWSPIAPCARIEVDLAAPSLSWSGQAYFDANAGSEPPVNAFPGWTWSRARVGETTAVLYDVARRAGDPLALALRFGADGTADPFAPPPRAVLPGSRWRVARATRSDAGHPARVVRTLQDTPFYARSLVAAHLFGQPVTAVHESLSLDRFDSAWVRWLLPFRMPRARS